jgi:hypothetical protein
MHEEYKANEVRLRVAAFLLLLLLLVVHGANSPSIVLLSHVI